MTESPETADKADKRGTPPGKGVVVRPNGSRIGNPAFVATDEQRHQVRQYAKTFPPHARRYIARLIGVSVDTLDRHFADDMELGRAQMLATVGSQVINRAINADAVDAEGKPIAKGDLDAQKFILARLGGWSTKVEHTGKGGAPIQTETRNFDLSNLTLEQAEAMLPVLDQILSNAGAEDAEFEEVGPEGEGDAASDPD